MQDAVNESLNLHAAALMTAQNNADALAGAYDNYIRFVIGSPRWSAEQPTGFRIPWQLARDASYSILKENFRSSGIYVFGSGAGIPLYLGRTVGRKRPQTFNNRMGRYVFGEYSQCKLAADYEPRLLEQGIDGFPEEVWAWYRKNYPNNGPLRLRHAVTFAQHGINDIWFTLLPIDDRSLIGHLEKQLIPIAIDWNESQGYPSLLNARHTGRK